MRRREFISLLGGAAASSASWPLTTRAQQSERMRRIGILFGIAQDTDGRERATALQVALGKLGWDNGRNLQIDIRWAPGNPKSAQPMAEALVATEPEIIFASPAPMVEALRRTNRTIPVVFVQSGDPVQAGFVQSHRRPGGNATGFVLWESSINTKYLQLLKDIAPAMTRVAVVQNPDNTLWRGDFAQIEDAARGLAMAAVATPVRGAADYERVLAAFASEPNGGVILPPDNTALRNRELIVALMAKHRLPAIYPVRRFVTSGGLMSYAADHLDIYARAASYVDRILKGEKPADLPVQTPTKYELVINLKTAKALGLTIPSSVLARADEVIE